MTIVIRQATPDDAGFVAWAILAASRSQLERGYAKAGFVFDGERRHPEFMAATGVPGLRRYLRKPR